MASAAGGVPVGSAVEVSGDRGDDLINLLDVDPAARIEVGGDDDDRLSGGSGRDLLDGTADEDPEVPDRLSGGSGRDKCVASVRDTRISC